jgi:hypothetical protein
MYQASGTVYRSGGKERVSYATIKVSKGTQIRYATTDDDGDFNLEVPDAGKWEFVALERGSYANNPMPIDILDDQPGIKIYLDRIAETSDEKTGKAFFWVLLGLLGVLMVVYIVTHVLIKPGARFSFWSDDPLRFVEILFWALAGILVSKIFTVSWYLRSHRFYREGMLMHIAHLAATPILVLVTILLLSLVTLEFTLANGNAISIDLSDPRIMVAFAFIIGTSPWPLWNFILNTAKRFTGQTG